MRNIRKNDCVSWKWDWKRNEKCDEVLGKFLKTFFDAILLYLGNKLERFTPENISAPEVKTE
jgi:hypothetical protein